VAAESIKGSSSVTPLRNMNLGSSSETNGDTVTTKRDTAITALEGMCDFLQLIEDLFNILLTSQILF
jgi:hypothetical protein